MQSKSHIYYTKAITAILHLHYRKDLPEFRPLIQSYFNSLWPVNSLLTDFRDNKHFHSNIPNFRTKWEVCQGWSLKTVPWMLPGVVIFVFIRNKTHTAVINIVSFRIFI